MSRNWWAAISAILFLALWQLPALAVQPDEVLKDTKLELRARDLSSELRCLVCQNQSIDDSDASLARDLRLLVRERLEAGDSDDQVRRFVVERYGEFVLLKPVFQPHTLVLWLTPAIVLLIGGVSILIVVRRRKKQMVAPLTEQEQAALDSLLRK